MSSTRDKYVGKVMTTKKGKKFTIIEYFPKMGDRRSELLLRFEGGAEKRIATSNLRDACHPDDMPKAAFAIGDVISSNNFGDAVVAEYVNSKKIRVRFKAGWECWVQADNARSGKFAPEGLLKTDGIQTFIEKSKAVYGNLYDYSNSVFVSATKPITIVCNRCGKEITIKQAGDHYSKKRRGCSECNTKESVEQSKLSFEDFIEQSGKAHNYKYTYFKEDFDGSNSNVFVCCNIHGKFKAKVSTHKNGGAKCPICVKEDDLDMRYKNYKLTNDYKKLFRVGDKVCVKHLSCGNIFYRDIVPTEIDCPCPICSRQRITFEKFLERTRECVPDEYEYAEYQSIGKPLKITHKLCGNSWYANAGGHINGNYGKPVGCPYCATHGFSYGRTGNLYVLQSNTGLVKVGVTHRRVDHRIRQIQKTTSKHIFNEVCHWKLDGKVAGNIEDEVHRLLRSQYEQPVEVFDGYTECFYIEDIEYVKDEISKLITTYSYKILKIY